MSMRIPDRDADGNIIEITRYSNEFKRQEYAVSFVATKDTTTTYDYKLENLTNFPNTGQNESYVYKYLKGGEFYAKDGQLGDFAEFSIIDKDNILGYGANFVLSKYVRKRWIIPNTVREISEESPGQIPVGVYLRCSYTSTSETTDVTLYLTYIIQTKEE